MKRLVIAILICLSAVSVQAQEVYNSSGRIKPRKQVKKKGFDRDKLILGGDVQLEFGTYTTLGVAPIIGYRFSNRFSAGLQIGYNYIKGDLYDYYGQKIETVKYNAFTAGLWARYFVWQNIFLQAEPEYNSVTYSSTYDPRQTFEFPRVMVGVGFKQPITDRLSFVPVVLYDVLQDPKSIYAPQLNFRFGLLVGF